MDQRLNFIFNSLCIISFRKTIECCFNIPPKVIFNPSKY